MTKQESINKFLVEVGEGGQWLNCSCGWKTHLDCCKINDNPDFSDPSNLIRLLKIAEKKNLYVDMWLREDGWVIEVRRNNEKRTDWVNQLISSSDIPSTLSELIARALGWKEGE